MCNSLASVYQPYHHYYYHCHYTPVGETIEIGLLLVLSQWVRQHQVKNEDLVAAKFQLYDNWCIIEQMTTELVSAM